MRRFCALIFTLFIFILSFPALVAPSRAGQIGPSAEIETSDPDEDAAIFLAGNLAFILFHEVGHALISLYDLPVLGREEDAVDHFSTILMIDDEGDPVMEQMIVSAAEGWFMSAAMAEAEGYELGWSDSHSLDLQRFYGIMCLVYASDPEAYTALADEIELPEDRRPACEAEYESVLNSWGGVLAPHLQPDNAPPRGPHISVHYGPADGFEDELEFLRASELLETVAEDISTAFVLPRPVKFTAQSCGEDNAYWDPETDSVIMCYELVTFYAGMLEDPAE